MCCLINRGNLDLYTFFFRKTLQLNIFLEQLGLYYSSGHLHPLSVSSHISVYIYRKRKIPLESVVQSPLPMDKVYQTCFLVACFNAFLILYGYIIVHSLCLRLLFYANIRRSVLPWPSIGVMGNY